MHCAQVKLQEVIIPSQPKPSNIRNIQINSFKQELERTTSDSINKVQAWRSSKRNWFIKGKIGQKNNYLDNSTR